MKNTASNKTIPIFIITFMAVIAFMGLSKIRNDAYNNETHRAVFSGINLFTQTASVDMPVSVNAVARSSTWGKVFDLNNEGLTENDYQAYTYDFTEKNNT